jgi:hypothetical protein
MYTHTHTHTLNIHYTTGNQCVIVEIWVRILPIIEHVLDFLIYRVLPYLSVITLHVTFHAILDVEES